MVSTRGPRSRYFEKGEKVLCYEPDPTKTKVLYDSKILGTYETKDKRGRKHLQYKVHFQGWSSSWDRKVNADFVLKDTEENRQLQRDLADKAQLQLDAYLYRKDRGSSSGSNKKRSRKSTVVLTSSTPEEDTSGAGGVVVDTSAAIDHSATSPTIRPRGSSEDNFSSGSTTFEKHEDFPMRDECETESYCSSVESFHDEERVMLRISERLRHYLEYDHDMTVKYGKQHTLPSRVPVIAILENFVKQSAVKLVYSTTQTENTRRRTTQQRNDKKEREFDKLVATVGLLKEVADGLRIYFDFTITDYLLYKEEKDYAMSYLSEDNLKNFTYVASSAGLSPDILNPKCEGSEPQTLSSSIADSGAEMHSTEATTPTTSEEPQKRKLRSHRSDADDCDLMLENCLSSIASTSSGASTPLHSNVVASSNINYLKSLQPMALSIPPQTKDFLQAVLSWRLLPSNAAPVASMIFGAAHLARLIVKLPEFLNASSLNDDKLKVLLQHLDSFTNYLEAHKEWFNEDNYARTIPSSKTANPSESSKITDPELAPQQQQQKSQPSQTQQNEVNTTTNTTTTTPTISSTIAT